METLRSAVLCACMISCAAALVSLITPEQSLARQMRFLLSVLFALSLAVPLTHLELPAKLSAEGEVLLTEQMQERLNEQVLAETKTRLEAVIAEELRRRGITCGSVSAVLHIGADGCIHISRVEVECDDLAGANAALPDLLGGEGDYEVTQIIRADDAG